MPFSLLSLMLVLLLLVVVVVVMASISSPSTQGASFSPSVLSPPSYCCWMLFSILLFHATPLQYATIERRGRRGTAT